MKLKFTHIYIGPTTRDGLAKNSPCRIVGHRAGGLQIMPASGVIYIVGRAQVIKATEPVSLLRVDHE